MGKCSWEECCLTVLAEDRASKASGQGCVEGLRLAEGRATEKKGLAIKPLRKGKGTRADVTKQLQAGPLNTWHRQATAKGGPLASANHTDVSQARNQSQCLKPSPAHYGL